MRRCFMASRLSRTRLTIRRPFSKRAPLTSTWSASVNWRLNDRGRSRDAGRAFLLLSLAAFAHRPAPVSIAGTPRASRLPRWRRQKNLEGQEKFQGVGETFSCKDSGRLTLSIRARPRRPCLARGSAASRAPFPCPPGIFGLQFFLNPQTKSTKERAPAEPRCLASMFLGGGRRWKRKCVKRER